MIENPYTMLANAIIVQAADDYRALPKKRILYRNKLKSVEKRLKDAKLTGDDEYIQRMKNQRDELKKKVNSIAYDKRRIERFFHSEWYRILTNVDGDIILKMLKAEMNRE